MLTLTSNIRHGLAVEMCYTGTFDECEAKAEEFRKRWALGYGGWANIIPLGRAAPTDLGASAAPTAPPDPYHLRTWRSLTAD